MKVSHLEGIHYSSRQHVRVEINDGRISGITQLGPIPGPADAAGKALPLVAPGMVELQINGFGGIDLNAPGLTAGQMEEISGRLLETGVTSYYPTLITGDPQRISSSLKAMAAAINRGGLAAKMVGGIHLEGPFICSEDGPRGAHPREWCRKPDPSLLEQWQEEAEGHVKILTLAPELPGNMEVIRRCRQMGITVSIGHTSAQTEDIKKAVEAGARLSTHLGNGCHGTLPRHPNYIWDQLAEDSLYASMIGDGFHLPDSVLKVFHRVKGKKSILVSDAMAYAGMEPGEYESPAIGRVVLTPEGKLHMYGKPKTLAGSASSLLQVVRHMSSITGFAEAWDMASVHPSTLMSGESPTGLVPGSRADLVLLEQDRLPGKIREIYLKGKKQTQQT